jgi:hypothetical protein
MKKSLTTLSDRVKLTLSKNFLGVSRDTLAVFFASKYAPVSVYREVCGKRPKRLVDNTGAPLYLKGVSQNNLLGGSI